MLGNIVGMQKALGHVIEALITSHPDPEKFRAKWQSMLTTISEQRARSTADYQPGFRKGFDAILERVAAVSGLGRQGPRDPRH